MGNCQTSTVISPNGKRGSGVLREGKLHGVPGRIFSNEGRSGMASVYTQQGCKGINQDAMILWEDFGSEGAVLCGVFDGHGPHGHLVARKVRDALPLKLLSFAPKNVNGDDGSQNRRSGCFRVSNSTGDDNSSSGVGPEVVHPALAAWRKAFLTSYKAMDKELRSHPTVDCFCSGSTAVTLLKLGSDLFVGNIGDSRAVLGSKDDNSDSMIAIQLTVDLKPDLPREAERIKRCKGRVFALQDEPEVPRVWLPFDDAPGLAMARAFGDFCLKDYGVISVPEFFHWSLAEKDQFIVLASDGVWDVLSNKEVVDIISSAPTRSSAAKVLIKAASREWKIKYPTSKMDDCAVVCLYLDGKMDESKCIENCSSTDACSENEETNNETTEEHNLEPSLSRNFTVRSGGSARKPAFMDEKEALAVTDDQDWSGLEGLTRVNSIVQLPRFCEDNVKA